ncbi:MAG: PASTA domain-containing protein [Parabacteroides sp.]|nr:PASTA domain-containing protein [Parabacteroides sp.]
MNGFLVKLIKNPYVLNILLAILVACGLVYGTLKWLDSYTRHNVAVVVPDVKGLAIEDAAEFFKNSNLRYNIIDSVYAKNVPPGAVVELVPMAGSKVKEGRIVFVTVNAYTSQMAIIPEVEALSFRQAYATLRACGFEKVEVEYVPGGFKDEAIAVEMDGRVLQHGEHIPLTASLVLKVSGGDDMPIDSLGISENDAPIESLNSEVENWF